MVIEKNYNEERRSVMKKNAGGCELFLLAFLHFAPAAEANQFKVYGYQGPDAGEVELVYWTDYIASSDLRMPSFGKAVDREGLFSHTLEVEYGITDRWTIAGYADFEQPSGERLEFVQWRAVFARYRFFERGARFFDTAIYLEYYIPRVAW